MSRISITNRGDFDNSSDPAAGSVSSGSGSNIGNDDPASPGNPAGVSNPSGGNNTNSGGQRRAPIANDRSNNSESSANNVPDDTERINQLRDILCMPDASIEELRAILRDNDRASENSRRSANDEEMARLAASARDAVPTTTTETASSSPPPRPRLSQSRTGSRRSWQQCQPAPSRPGIFRVGGPIQTGGTYNIGVTDEMDLEIKRIEAVSQVQDALNDKLGYDLRESGQYEEMEREFQEGERMLATTGMARREKKVLPAMMKWEAPPVSRSSMSKKEPNLPEPGEPLPLPTSFGGYEGGMHNGGNSEICVGKFVDPGPNHDEDEEKREEFSVDNESWAGISIDATPMGPYEHVVRCWKCRAGLRVHIEVGLVACPRCRTISPTTELVYTG